MVQAFDEQAVEGTARGELAHGTGWNFKYKIFTKVNIKEDLKGSKPGKKSKNREATSVLERLGCTSVPVT